MPPYKNLATTTNSIDPDLEKYSPVFKHMKRTLYILIFLQTYIHRGNVVLVADPNKGIFVQLPYLILFHTIRLIANLQ